MARLRSSPETKVGRKCTVCVHPDRDEIDRLLVVPGTDMTEIARIFGLHARNICRHRAVHLSKLIRSEAAQRYAASESERGASLLDQIGGLRDRAIGILDRAEATTNHDTALRAIREARGCIEIMAKITGQIEAGTTINVFSSPTWVTVQSNVIAALAPYPEAREAVVRALAPPQ